MSLESYLKNSKTVRKNDLWPGHRSEQTYKDNLFGLSYGPDARVLYTGKDPYTRAGLDYLKAPRTWDELEEAVRRTMVRQGDGLATLGFDPYFSSSSYNNWLVPFWQLGGELTNKEGTKITIANETGVKALTWIQKIMDIQGGWNVVKAFRAGSTREQKFVDGQVGNIYLTFATRGQEFRTLAPAGVQFGYASFPLPPGGRKATFGGNSVHMIPTGAPNRDAAWLFLEVFYEDEQVLQYANRYDRVPVKISVAKSDKYLQNDPFRKLMIDDMAGRKWFVEAPGAPDMRQQILDLPTVIMEKGVSIQSALTQAQTEMQRVLDEALRL
jgi:multiple sugar transport system substrate-binding protein